MEQAQLQGTLGTGLLLDQEKAYDRVHPQYLGKTLKVMGFGNAFVNTITSLFFGNTVQININGNFTKDIQQQRGLRQGDPLSPLLFNVALEPFLRSILQDTSFQGHRFSSTQSPSTYLAPPPIKLLAYAVDVCVFLSSLSDFDRLQHHMRRYTQVSNAQFNQHKTEAFALNGTQQPDWTNTLHDYRITTYHHRFTPNAFRYLGFPMCYTPGQRQNPFLSPNFFIN